MRIQQTLNTKEIGARVRQLRKSRGITQDELGEILGDTLTGKPMSRGQVSNLETGKRNFNIHQLKALADFFHVSMDTLGIKSDELDTIDLFERARLLFENEDIPIKDKQELYEGIMTLYISAKEQMKNNAQH